MEKSTGSNNRTDTRKAKKGKPNYHKKINGKLIQEKVMIYFLSLAY